MKAVTIGESNPRSSSKTSSSIQRTLVHMDTQGERQQDKFTRVLGNFQRVRQSRTQNTLEEEEKINKLKNREKSMRQLGSEDLVTMVQVDKEIGFFKDTTKSRTSKSCANGLFSKSFAMVPSVRNSVIRTCFTILIII